MNFYVRLANWVPNSQLGKEWGGAENFKGLSQDGGQAKLAENLHASPFNDDLSNDTTFS